MQRTILVIGAGPLHYYTIREAKSLGLRVVATDRNIHAPGFAIADAWYTCDVYDIQGHRELVHRLCDKGIILAGVTCAGGDSAPTVAAVAEEAGLPGVPYEVAVRTWDKYEVRFALEKAGLQQYQPRWGRWETQYLPLTHVSGPAFEADVLGYPIVLKPCQQRASRGVTIVRNYQELGAAVACVSSYSSTLLLEELLVGSEHSAEIVLDASGSCVHFHVCDRFFTYEGGRSIEIGHINPTCLDSEKQRQIKTMLLEASKALGVHFGSFKVDVLFAEDGPKILEVAARASGGYDSQRTYPQSSKDNLLKRIIQISCGLPFEQQPYLFQAERYVACAAILPNQTGTITQLPACNEDVVWHAKVGETVTYPLEHNAQRLGFVFAEAQDYDEAWREAKETAEEYPERITVEQ